MRQLKACEITPISHTFADNIDKKLPEVSKKLTDALVEISKLCEGYRTSRDIKITPITVNMLIEIINATAKCAIERIKEVGNVSSHETVPRMQWD